jgi:hypothetical protein
MFKHKPTALPGTPLKGRKISIKQSIHFNVKKNLKVAAKKK